MNNNMIKIFYDAEFTGLHRNTTLISIGMVSESGSYFYAEFTDYDKSQVEEWLQDNVINNLLHNDKETVSEFNTIGTADENGRRIYNASIKDTSDVIKRELLEWLHNESIIAGKKIQFYTDCYAYDWVLLNDLICEDGKALNIPDYIYYIPMDLSTALQYAGYDPDLSREDFADGWFIYALRRGIFKDYGSNIKHNCLWDAAVCRICFARLINPQSSKFIKDFEKIDNNFNHDPWYQYINNKE